MTPTSTQEEINGLKAEMKSVHGKLDKILTILGGDELGYSEGIVNDMKGIKSELNKVKEDVQGLIDFKKRIYWLAASLALVFNIAYSYIKDFVTKS